MAGASTLPQGDPPLGMRLHYSEPLAPEVGLATLLHQRPKAGPSTHRPAPTTQEMATPDAHSASQTDPTTRRPTTCPICLEPARPASQFRLTTCPHIFCIPCMRTHLTHLATDSHQYPIPCPTCRVPLDPNHCLTLLTGPPHAALERLILERGHHKNIRYCANPPCAAAFDYIPDPSISGFTDEFRVTCPLCKHPTCVSCKTAWHTGQTCAQHRAEKQNSDALLRLARQNDWTPCPRCGHFIDRTPGDCNFVRCRCGCGFCHKCGLAYLSLAHTPENTHGQPACACGLFGLDYLAPLPRPAPVRPRAPAWQGLDRMRLVLDGYADGPNGYCGIGSWLNGVPGRRLRLPVRIFEEVSEARCPYDDCGTVFGDYHALDQHLANVRRHDVWLCCGRPFTNENAREMHRNAVH